MPTTDLDSSTARLTRPLRRPRDTEKLARIHAMVRGEVFVEREDIRFSHAEGDSVDLQVTVHNFGQEISEPMEMRISAAPFGAFVPSTEVDRVMVPAIAARSSETIRRRISRLAGIFSFPEGKADESRPEEPNREEDPLLWFMWRLTSGRGYFAGNFDIHIGAAKAERHLARPTRLDPGRENLAMFVVGDRKDTFQFDFRGVGADHWEPSLFALTAGSIEAHSPVQLDKREKIIFSFSPDSDCRDAAIAVGVQRISSGQEALVEFAYGEHALKPGCFRRRR